MVALLADARLARLAGVAALEKAHVGREEPAKQEAKEPVVAVWDDSAHGHAHRSVVAHEVLPDGYELLPLPRRERRLDVLEEPWLKPEPDAIDGPTRRNGINEITVRPARAGNSAATGVCEQSLVSFFALTIRYLSLAFPETYPRIRTACSGRKTMLSAKKGASAGETRAVSKRSW